MGLLFTISFLGSGIGLLAMLYVIMMRRDPNGRLVLAGLVAMLIGYGALIGTVVIRLSR